MPSIKTLNAASSLYNKILLRLATTIKEYRAIKGIPITQLSDLSGVSTTVISDLENKKYIPKVEVIIRLIVALELPLYAFIPENSIAKDIVSSIDENSSISENETYETISKLLLNMGLDIADIEQIMDYTKYKVDVRLHKAPSKKYLL